MSNWKITINQVFISICVVTAVIICAVIILTQRNPSQFFPPVMLSKHRLHPTNWTLIDLPNFRYVINNPICDRSVVHLVILIHAAPSHFHERDTIRNTWGGRRKVKGYETRTVFLLGAVRDTRLQYALEQENSENRDLVQGNFFDSYKNLTYKHVMGLRWVSNYCRHARYVMKMDDDIYVEIYHFFDKIFGQRLKKAIACYLQNQMPVVRDNNSKWYVSENEYKGNTFDNYCSGWAYITDPLTAKLLAVSAANFQYFWVDDVHVTGTIAKQANVTLIAINKWFTIESDALLAWTRSKDKLKWNYIFGPTWGDTVLMTLAHQKAKWCQWNQCACCFSIPSSTTSTPSPNATRGHGIVKPIVIGHL